MRIATIISLNVNTRRYVCHSIDVSDLVKASMKAFGELTNAKVYDYEVGYSTCNFSYGFKHSDIFTENLCGKLLFRYIDNNIMPYIIKGKCSYVSGGKWHVSHKE